MKRKMKKALAMVMALSICLNKAGMNVFAQEKTMEMSKEVLSELQTEMSAETQSSEMQTEIVIEKNVSPELFMIIHFVTANAA